MTKFRKIKSLKFLYEISNNGILRNVKSKKVLKPQIDKDGYLIIDLQNKAFENKSKNVKIHRLVAEAWMKNKPDNWEELTINHKDYNKHNNHISNLEFISREENSRDRFYHYEEETRKRLKTYNEERYGYFVFIAKNSNDELRFNTSLEAANYIAKLRNKDNLKTMARVIRDASEKNKFRYGFKWTRHNNNL